MSSRRNIVLIEDEPILVTLYSVALQAIGEVASATCQAEAEQTLSKVIPDVILLDLILPKTKTAQVNFNERMGFEIFQWIKRQPRLTSVPVIIMTNLDSAEDRKMAEQLGAKGYIVKSNVIPKQIIEAIEQVL